MWFFLLAAQEPVRVDKAFSGKYLYETAEGRYLCANCKSELFSSKDKYDSGSGWPSFKTPVESQKVYYQEDFSLPFKRYEVLCRGCNGKLGHVFNDGPPPKGLRYCIHSSALFFERARSI